MLVSSRVSTSIDRIPSEYFQDSYNVLCCPLRDSGMDVVAGNHIVMTNANFSEGACYFNGSNAFGVTTRAINLTTTQKVMVYADIRFDVYGLTTNQMLVELSDSYLTKNDAFNFVVAASTANDPIAVNIGGNVSFESALSNLSLSRLDDRNKHSIVGIYDKSAAQGKEVDYYQDGQRLVTSVTAVGNNTNSFGNYVLYIGMRAGTSLPLKAWLSNIIIRSTVDSPETIADYTAWLGDKRRSRGVSLTGVMSIPLDRYVPASQYPKLVINESGDQGLVVADLSHGPDKNTIAEVRRMEKFNN